MCCELFIFITYLLFIFVAVKRLYFFFHLRVPTYMLELQKADFAANIEKTVLFNSKISLMDIRYIFIPLNYDRNTNRLKDIEH